MQRRRFLRTSAALGLGPLLGTVAARATGAGEAAAAAGGWSGGRVLHLVPAASASRLQVKAVFATPLARPLLRIGGRTFAGTATDSSGHGFAFDADGLAAGTEYELRIHDGTGAVSEPWPLATLPAGTADPGSVRLLLFTCAGGHPLASSGDTSSFLPMEVRRRLLARALSFAPQAVVANGDHLYWDQRTSLESASAERAERARTLQAAVGLLDRSLPALGTPNEALLKLVAGEQITPVYGTTLRSLPAYFINDDHDHFENDEATDRFVTLPPEHYQRDFLGFVRGLYLPDFLPDDGRPRGMSGTRADGGNPNFGAFRYGRLCEMLLYDCAGYLSLKGDVAGLVPPEVEQWLLARTADEQVAQLLHVPGHPLGYTAGKWREWYPDVADSGGEGAQVARMGAGAGSARLTATKPKFLWQRGWWQQHQRLVSALSAQRRRAAIVLSGDLHATGHARIVRSGDLALGDNPVNAILTGPLGTGSGWPSSARGTAPQPPHGVELETVAPVSERNGFTILDVTADDVRVRLFAWRREQAPVEAIDTLEPYHDVRVRRGGIG